jgi:hypothetical protein
MDLMKRLDYEKDDGRNGLIWRQVDLVRLFVQEYILLSVNNCISIYSDMDLDIDSSILDSASISERLELFGMLFMEDFKCNKKMFENSFIMMGRKALPFLQDKLIPATKKAALEDKANGWIPLIETLFSHVYQQKEVSYEKIVLSLGGGHDVLLPLTIPIKRKIGKQHELDKSCTFFYSEKDKKSTKKINGKKARSFRNKLAKKREIAKKTSLSFSPNNRS